MKPKSNEFLLTNEVARILLVTPQTVRTLNRKGLLPAEKTPTGVRIFRLPVVEEVARQRAARRRPPQGKGGAR